jgi:excisionase family DNA binding protein
MENEIINGSRNVMLSVAQAAEHLGVGKSTVNRLIGERKISSVKIGRRRLIPENALTSYVEGLKGKA